jgi:rare lipoprotein A (peptidoglycan hydrolase)
MAGAYSGIDRKAVRYGLLLVLLAIAAQSCAVITQGNAPTVLPTPLPAAKPVPSPNLGKGQPATGAAIQRGEASWYGPGLDGKKTASGDKFDQTELTAAHQTFPLGSKVKVTNLKNGKTAEVEITDRGPFVQGRIIDVSKAAAEKLGMIGSGTVPVEIELLPVSVRPRETAHSGRN